MSENEEIREPDNEASPKRRSSIGRTLAKIAGLFFGSTLILLLVIYGLYRGGVFDNYIKDQFVRKLNESGVNFEARNFNVTAAPLELVLDDANFTNAATGERLLFIKNGRLGLTILDLMALKLTRDISIDKTDISGAELWINIDENGRSNFSGLKFVEDERGSAVNFKYDSVNVSIRDSLVHFGDISRKISGEGRELNITLTPRTDKTADGEPRFDLFLAADNSSFTYDTKAFESIGIRAKASVDELGADIEKFDITSPVGTITLNGRVDNWNSPRYTANITSTADLTQISTTLETATAIRGVGNFKGTLTGEGEQFKIEGVVDSESLRADGVFVKGVNIEGTVSGTNEDYEANGTAVAEMLTYDDLRIDVLRAAGNVRGTGTDFRWVGELQAIAVKSGAMTIGSLFLKDAIAELRDRELTAQASNGRAKRFEIGDVEFEELQARNLKFSMPSGGIDISAPNATTARFKTPDYELKNVQGKNIRVKNANRVTTVDVDGVSSSDAELAGAKVMGVTANGFNFRDDPSKTDVTISGIKARRVDSDGTIIDGVEAPEIAISNRNGLTTVYADRSRVARIDTGAAVLGDLNIAGIRLSIRNGIVEGRSDDIDAGDIQITKSDQLATGGKLEGVKIARPIFVVERSGRYRASADMSIGGGTIGSIALGAATAKVLINNDLARLTDLNADVMNGKLDGNVAIALDNRTRSDIDVRFDKLDLSKLIALQSGRVIPLQGETSGTAKLSYPGGNWNRATGNIDASIVANAGDEADTAIPINGNVAVDAADGLFSIANLDLKTDKSSVTGNGIFDLKTDKSDLTLALRSSDGSEIQRLVEVSGVAPEIDEQLRSMDIELAGDLTFDAKLTGNLLSPTVQGKAMTSSVVIKGRNLGSVATDVFRDELVLELRDGSIKAPDGGSAAFAVSVPAEANKTSVKADLNGMNAGDLIAALPSILPDRIRDLTGRTSGKVDITGLPNNAQGNISLSAANGTFAGQPYDTLKAEVKFDGTLVTASPIEIALSGGTMGGTFTLDRKTSDYTLALTARSMPVPILLAILPKNESIPSIAGTTDLKLTLAGNSDRAEIVSIDGNGKATGVTVGESNLGEVTFDANAVDQKLTAKLVIGFNGNPQTVDAVVDLSNKTLPLQASTVLNNSPLDPLIAFIPQLKGLPISGSGSGRITVNGELVQIGPDGKPTDGDVIIRGRAEFSALDILVQDTRLVASEPVLFNFDAKQLDIEKALFAGGGSNVRISGTKAFADDAVNDLAIDGRISLNLLNLLTKDTFFAGLADVAVRLSGPNATARLSGSASTENASFAAFIGNDRLTLERVKSRIIFSADQADIEEMSGYIGGGRFSGSGGAAISGIGVSSFRLSINGTDVTVPLPTDFITTGDARLEITGQRDTPKEDLQITIGGRVYARRSLYSKDIDLANVVGARRERAITSGGSGSLKPVRFDLTIEGRDALVVKNNIADLTATVSLVLSGDANEPRLSGRITANSGTIFFRKDRYIVQRGVLEFPPDTFIDPILQLQGETEIAGYQIFVTYNGPLKDSETAVLSVRSSPALPQADVVSLITTGSLTNSAGGIPTLAQSGINTAAEILTDSIINNPARKATDKLFGLNVFEIDPLISGRQANPSARLTVGRQINNNLRVTYSTNLSQDQNQVLALEYRVSNKLSLVAQYEQRSLSNVTRNRDSFSFEVRLRKRF